MKSYAALPPLPPHSWEAGIKDRGMQAWTSRQSLFEQEGFDLESSL